MYYIYRNYVIGNIKSFFDVYIGHNIMKYNPCISNMHTFQLTIFNGNICVCVYVCMCVCVCIYVCICVCVCIK